MKQDTTYFVGKEGESGFDICSLSSEEPAGRLAKVRTTGTSGISDEAHLQLGR